MEAKMKKVGMTVSVFMGVTLSFCLSLVGNLLGSRQSGAFSVPGWLISFVVSTIISLIIGFIVPMKKISDSIHAKNGGPRSLKARLIDTLVSDLIYTPVITLAMVFLAYRNATAHGAQMPFLPMFLSSLVVSLIVAYILIFILMPVFLKLSLKLNGIQGPPIQAPGNQG